MWVTLFFHAVSPRLGYCALKISRLFVLITHSGKKKGNEQPKQLYANRHVSVCKRRNVVTPPAVTRTRAHHTSRFSVLARRVCAIRFASRVPQRYYFTILFFARRAARVKGVRDTRRVIGFSSSSSVRALTRWTTREEVKFTWHAVLSTKRSRTNARMPPASCVFVG